MTRTIKDKIITANKIEELGLKYHGIGEGNQMIYKTGNELYILEEIKCSDPEKYAVSFVGHDK